MKPLEMIRSRPAWVVPALAALVIAGALIYQQRALDQLADVVQRSSSANRLQVLDERISALEQSLAAVQKQPRAASLAQLTEMQKALEQRFSTLDSRLTERALVSELQAVQDSVTALKASVQKLEALKPAPHIVTRPAIRPALKAPPFTIQGIEVRGGQSFLAISPLDQPAPENVQLLRVGDGYQGWRLEALEPNAAVFRVSDQNRRLDVR